MPCIRRFTYSTLRKRRFSSLFFPFSFFLFPFPCKNAVLCDFVMSLHVLVVYFKICIVLLASIPKHRMNSFLYSKIRWIIQGYLSRKFRKIMGWFLICNSIKNCKKKKSGVLTFTMKRPKTCSPRTCNKGFPTRTRWEFSSAAWQWHSRDCLRSWQQGNEKMKGRKTFIAYCVMWQKDERNK